MTRILVTGCDGQVGWELLRSCQPLGEVTGVNRAQCNLAEPAALRAALAAHRPDVILNAAAYTAVDKAESEEALATAINGDAVGVIAEFAAATGALVIHYSTDYVFDGSGNTPHSESDPTAPVNAYGRSKLAGEIALANSAADWLCFRTSWVYSHRCQNFPRTILRLARERETLRIIDDQIGAPTSARLIADVTAIALLQSLRDRAAGRFDSQLLHLVASGQVSWHGFATELIAAERQSAGAAALKVQAIEPIPTRDYPTPARRPLNSRLDCSALEQRFGIRLPAWQAGVALHVSGAQGA
ncbi:dTDP-4-dehydrorhamnose reductase [Derxia lacustris]|uniref:dTDP-4-dehydrorhamnose reductase n=1 Tax=Derxia lacustris TaxID=764842 RepID=UPI000A16D925|nr:dTDP-4-dehydrorhamnose reductase [Derxia lacustris]